MSKVIFKEPDIESQIIIVIDHNIALGVSSNEGKGDEYSPEKIKACNIPVYSDSHFVWVIPSIATDTVLPKRNLGETESGFIINQSA